MIRPVEESETTDAGVLMIRDYKDPDVQGDVLALGARAADVCSCGRARTPDVSVGDRVLFPPSAGQVVVVDGERLLMVPIDQVLAILEDDPC